jgi:hypothetical protein
MPFSLIPTVLGVGFALVWVFIGGIILRDGQFAVRRARETESTPPADAHRRSAGRRLTRHLGRGVRPLPALPLNSAA